MYRFVFTKYWKKTLDNLSTVSKERIIKKLKSLKSVENINQYLKIVHNLEPATHRMRIWNYRILLNINWKDINILKIWNRWNIYK
jgi:mRNA-degrading endonuclease RelE of RelBE toxin-antitoxin system